ncbi:MAG: hypothetical protein A2216_03845 [Omnitrophica WOR_2 bacterium RIFOXYA2_FULL_45_12]|nr:MAG: hypothetical protein A2216_03845 [Omnitrophica WOR_2 bacterium RIFOXYA2_FULL_45_12]
MDWREIEKKAVGLNIKHPDRYAKTDLIKTIQRAEGNFDCFQTPQNSACNQSNCCWRSDCLQ